MATAGLTSPIVEEEKKTTCMTGIELKPPAGPSAGDKSTGPKSTSTPDKAPGTPGRKTKESEVFEEKKKLLARLAELDVKQKRLQEQKELDTLRKQVEERETYVRELEKSVSEPAIGTKSKESKTTTGTKPKEIKATSATTGTKHKESKASSDTSKSSKKDKTWLAASFHGPVTPSTPVGDSDTDSVAASVNPSSATRMEAPSIIASLHHTISSHTSDVNGVCFSKTKILATCSGDKTLRLWDTDDYSELPCSPLYGHTYYVHCCMFSPFGTLLASCSTDGKVIIWDTKTGKKKGVLQHESKSPIRVCRFSPNSQMLVSGGDDHNICLWDITTETLVSTFRGHEGTVFGCDFTPDCQHIVSGSSDGDLQVWDAKYGHGKALLLELESHDLGVTYCDFSPTYGVSEQTGPPTGTSRFLLATCGQDDVVKLWDFTSIAGTTSVLLKEKYVLRGHTDTVMQCRFSLNGKLLASGSIDKTVRIWDPLTGAALHVIEGHKRYVTCCAFSSDGQYLASGSNDKTVMVWKLQSEQQLFTALETKDGLYIEDVPETDSIDVSREIKSEAEKWTVDDVCKWIEEIGLDQYKDNFKKHDIDGQELLTLNQESLMSGLGVDSLGHRNKILRCRSRLLEHPIVQQKELDAGVPDEFLCPITREIMRDPVICSDGYTYERAAITSWIQKGKDRSPMTNAVLVTKDLTPNRSLKMIIQRYLNP